MKNKYLKYAKKQIKTQALTKSLFNNFKKNGYIKELEFVYKRASELFYENDDKPNALKYHLNQILPCIAFYEALLNKCNSQEEAEKVYESFLYDEVYKMSKLVKVIANIFYKKVPKLFDIFFNKLYGNDAGFVYNIPSNSKVFTRDVLVCPYNETCKKYGHPELTKYFCKSDDITYKNMHDKLIWNRTKTLGYGDDCCDFRLHLK